MISYKGEDYVKFSSAMKGIDEVVKEKDKEIERLQHNAEVSTKWEIKLTQENTKLKEENKNIISWNYENEDIKKYLLKRIKEQQDRIDKAIEFNKYVLNGTWYGGNEKIYAQRNLNILQGSDKE